MLRMRGPAKAGTSPQFVVEIARRMCSVTTAGGGMRRWYKRGVIQDEPGLPWGHRDRRVALHLGMRWHGTTADSGTPTWGSQAASGAPTTSITVEAYNAADGTRIAVAVHPDIIDGQFRVDGLRDAIARYKRWDGDPSTIKIYRREGDGTKGKEVPSGPLPCDAPGKVVRSYVFELLQKNTRAAPRPSAAPRDPSEFDVGALVDAIHRCDVARTKAFKVTRSTEPDSELCAPYKVGVTMNEDALKECLATARQELEGLIPGSEPRTPRIAGLSIGTGCGKTHALLEAPRLLGASFSVHIAYNLGQHLVYDTDKAFARKAVLLRIIFGALGIGNKAANTLLMEHIALFRGLAERALEAFAVAILADKAVAKTASKALDTTDIFIGIDEIRKLGDEDCIRFVRFALGSLAVALFQQNVACTVLVSSLTRTTFATISDTCVAIMKVPSLTSHVASQLVERLVPDHTAFQKAIILGVGGGHYRSIVAACATIRDRPTNGRQITFQELLDAVQERLCLNMSYADMTAICHYVQDCVKMYHVGAWTRSPLAEQFSDAEGAIAPALLLMAYEGDDVAYDLILKFFGTLANVDATKQLEQCGMAYDQFRAHFGLPVVPFGVRVHGPPPPVPFDGMTFRSEVAYEIWERSILPKDEGATTSHVAVNIPTDHYCRPCDPTHPWIDRACWMENDKGERALLIAQDKISSAGFAEDVADLNKAADVLHAALNVPILCFVHDVAASQGITAQAKLNHPHILVRDDREIRTFYTPTFAPTILFVRARHQS